MVINDKEEFLLYLKCLRFLGLGSEGMAYYDKRKKVVLKIYHDCFSDEFKECKYITKEEVLKFSEIINKTFIFPQEEIIYDDYVIGYVTSYQQGKTIDEINPLRVKFQDFINAALKVDDDIKILSENNILTFDVLYNTMYGRKKISVIDPTEYCFSKDSYEKLLDSNRKNFNTGVILFLIDSYFDEFVLGNKELNELYRDRKQNIKYFLTSFKKYLSEYIGSDITKLQEAKKAMNKEKHKVLFERKVGI